MYSQKQDLDEDSPRALYQLWHSPLRHWYRQCVFRCCDTGLTSGHYMAVEDVGQA